MTKPLNLRTPVMSSGFGISRTAWTLSLSGFKPLSLMTCPMNFTSDKPTLVFCLFSLRFFSWHLFIRFLMFSLWSAMASSVVSPLPTIRISSATGCTPRRPSKAWSCLLWYSSGLLFRPWGILFQRYLPFGVLKVVNFELSWVNSTWQNPSLASITLNTFALLSSGNISSIVGIG